MNRLIQNPFPAFWFSFPIIIFLGILGSDETFSINIHDTYLVFSRSHLAILISIIFAVIGLGYWLMGKFSKKLSKWLNLVHLVLTFPGILLIFILAQLFREPTVAYGFNNNLTLVVYVTALIVILGQVVYPLNIIIGLLRERNSS